MYPYIRRSCLGAISTKLAPTSSKLVPNEYQTSLLRKLGRHVSRAGEAGVIDRGLPELRHRQPVARCCRRAGGN